MWVLAAVVALLVAVGVDVETLVWNAVRVVATLVAVSALLMWILRTLRERRHRTEERTL